MARKLVAGREIVLGLAVLVHALVTGDDAGDAGALIDELGAGKMREDVDARLFHELTEPLHQLIERDDVVAVVPQRRRSDRKLQRAGGGEEIGRIVGDGSIERRGLLEVRNQLAQSARVHDRAGELVRAEFARLLEHINILGGKRGRAPGLGVLFDEPRKMQRTGQPARPRADDEYVRFELLALHRHRDILAEWRSPAAIQGLAGGSYENRAGLG